jgi:hypothetical protein
VHTYVNKITKLNSGYFEWVTASKCSGQYLHNIEEGLGLICRTAVQDQQAECKKAIQSLFPPRIQDAMLHEVQHEIASQRSQPKVSLVSLLSDRLARSQLHIGVMLQVLQQFCGINTVMYFTPLILQWAGFTDRRQALLWGCLPAACNTIGTVAGAALFFAEVYHSLERYANARSLFGTKLANENGESINRGGWFSRRHASGVAPVLWEQHRHVG